VARVLAERDGIREGLVCVFTRVEQAQNFKLKFGKDRPHLVAAQPECLCLCFNPLFQDLRRGMRHRWSAEQARNKMRWGVPRFDFPPRPGHTA